MKAVMDGLSKATALPIWDLASLREANQKMGGEPPVWIQVFPYPTYVCTIDGEKRTLITDDISQSSIVDLFSEKGNDLFIDYEHATTTAGVFYAPAAGRIVEVAAGGKLGLLARCEWTDEAAEDIRAGRYYYDSPSLWWALDDSRVYALAGMALTNYPGSFNRPYITDHNDVNYEALLKRSAAKAAAPTSIEARPLQLVCAKGGRTMKTLKQLSEKITEGVFAAAQKLVQSTQRLTDSVLHSMRYTFDLPLTTTGNELIALLTALLGQVPATDEPIFIVANDEKGIIEGAKTLGDAVRMLSQQGTEPAPAVVVDLRPLRVLLGVTDEKAGVPELTTALVNMKANTAPVARVLELEQQLATAKTTTVAERVNLLIANNKGTKSLTPHIEAETRRLASESYDLAEMYIDALPLLDLSSQSAGTAPTKVTDAPGSDDVVSESKSAHTRTLAIAKEKGITYQAANDLRKAEQAAAAQE